MLFLTTVNITIIITIRSCFIVSVISILILSSFFWCSPTHTVFQSNIFHKLYLLCLISFFLMFTNASSIPYSYFDLSQSIEVLLIDRDNALFIKILNVTKQFHMTLRSYHTSTYERPYAFTILKNPQMWVMSRFFSGKRCQSILLL